MTDPNKPIVNTQYTVDGEQPSIVPQGTNNGGGSSTTTPPPVVNEPPKTDSTTTTTNNTTTISSTAPQQYKVNNNDELIKLLEQRMNENKPLTEEELKKLRRKQKIEGIISGVADAAQSIANLYYTTQYAPNMYNAKEGMSAKAKERFDKEKEKRDADNDRYFNYAMQIAKLKGEDADRGLQVWQTEQNLARQDRTFDASRQDRADDVAFRNKDYDERVRQWQAGFDRDEKWHQEEGERWEKQFNESVRQFNVSSANERARINMEGQRLAQELKNGQMTFNLGSGNGNVTLTNDKLNAQTVSRIYQTLDPSIRAKVQGDPIVQNGLVVGYKPPTTEAMLIAIGANVENSPATQNAIKQVAGLEKGNKPAAY
jgi:hypothetical protein